MKKIKFAFPKSILGISGTDWIRRLKKMRAISVTKPNGFAYTIEIMTNDKDNAAVSTTDPIIETGASVLLTSSIENKEDPAVSFFWPRPSAAMYERYKMQFSF